MFDEVSIFMGIMRQEDKTRTVHEGVIEDLIYVQVGVYWQQKWVMRGESALK